MKGRYRPRLEFRPDMWDGGHWDIELVAQSLQRS